MRTLVLMLVLLLVTPAFAGDEAPVGARVPDVNVTSTRNPAAVETLTGRAASLVREELDLRDAWTLEEAVRAFPGVDVVGNSRYGEEVRFNTRGVTSGYGTQRTLVLLDGRPLTDEYAGNVDVGQYPLAAMRRLEMVLGPASALYGTNALGGVVNLIPRRGGEKMVTEVSAEGGSFGTMHGTLAHGRMVGPVDLFLTADATVSDGYQRNDAGDQRDWMSRSIFGNVGWTTDRLDVRAYLSAFGGQGTDTDFDRDIERFLTDLGFTYQLDPDRDAVTSLRLYRSHLRQTLDWFFAGPSDYDQTSLGAILTQTWRVHPAHLLTGGAEWRKESAEVAEFAGKVDKSASTVSIFGQDEWQLTEDLRIVAGLRYDKRSRIDGEFSWRGGANWQVIEGTIIRAAIGRAFRAPTISDQFLPDTPFFGMVFAGNPDLDPEVLLSGEIGVDQVITDGLTGSVTAYLTKAKDFWDFLPDSTGKFRPQNIAKVDIRGLEVVIAADLGRFLEALDGLTASASYTQADATYDEFTGRPDVEGNRLDDSVRHRGTFALGWHHPDGHAARVGLLISSDRYTDPENSGAGHLSSYYVLDFQAMAVVAEGVAITLNVQNALNHGYRTRPEFREPPRAIFGGVRITF